MFQILVCDDERILRESLAEALRTAGHHVETMATGEEVLQSLKEQGADILLCDMRLPGINGLDVLRQGLLLCPDLCFMMMTAYSTVDTAVEALRLGAFDYLLKPILHADLLARVTRFEELKALRRRNELLRRELARNQSVSEIQGSAIKLVEVMEQARRVARTDATVLLTGESGTGKELLARYVHRNSPRHKGPFVPVNLAAIPDSLIDGQLFGHVRGAFTGASGSSEGLFVSAKEGTVFLDEIGELPLQLQAKLLRVVENREVLQLGHTRPRPIDVRIVAATNRNLQDDVTAGTFRADLFFRLAVVTLRTPPLRERVEDIPMLVDHFLHSQKQTVSVTRLSSEAMRALLRYTWPGNVRELKNVIQRGCIFCQDVVIKLEDLPAQISRLPEAATSVDLKSAMRLYEERYIKRILEQKRGDKKAACQVLGIGLSSLYRKLDTGGRSDEPAD